MQDFASQSIERLKQQRQSSQDNNYDREHNPTKAHRQELLKKVIWTYSHGYENCYLLQTYHIDTIRSAVAKLNNEGIACYARKSSVDNEIYIVFSDVPTTWWGRFWARVIK